MKKIILSIILCISLLSLVSALTYDYTTNWFYNSNPVNNIRAINFVCNDLNCYTLGTRLSDDTSTTNSITISYPLPSPDYGYATYWFSSCYLSQKLAYKPCFPTSCSSNEYSANLDFARKSNCNAAITNFNSPSSINKNQQVTITADIDSAFSRVNLAPFGEPNDADIVRDYLSAQTNIILEVRLNTVLVHTETAQEYILRDNEESVSFTYTPTQAGVYNITLKTNVVDCKCSSNVVKQVSKILTVNEVAINCCENSDCGNNGYIGSNYCLSGNVYRDFKSFFCNNPGTTSSYCSNTINSLLIQTCAYGCSNGECLPAPECTQDSDCGSSQLVNKFCKNGNSWGNYSNPVCISGNCGITYSQSLIQTCPYGCSNGECLPEQEIACYTNSDCGNSGCAGGANYCMFNNVYQDFIFFTCNNPGTTSSYCSNTTSPFLLEECDYSCSNGFCVDEPSECSSNSDCGSSQLVNNYCSGNNVMNNYSVPSCIFGECEINFVQSLNQTCAYGCSNGECLPEQDECSVDSDCGLASSSLICIGNNVTNATLTPFCINGTCQSSASYLFVKECQYGCSNGKCNSCDEDDDKDYKGYKDEDKAVCGNDICEYWLDEDEFNCEEDCEEKISFFYNSEDTPQILGEKKDSSFVGINLILIMLILFILLLLILILVLRRR
jgi:hypothetical protein